MRRTVALVLGVLVLSAGCLSLGQGDASDASDGPADPSSRGEERPVDQRPPAQAPTFREPVEVTRHTSAEPAAIVGPDGSLNVLVWRDVFRRTDGGATYAPIETPFSDNGDSDLIYRPDGTGHYVGMGIDDGGPKLPYHRDPGQDAWSKARELAPNSTSVDRPWITDAGTQRLVVTWNDYEEEVNHVRVSPDGGTTWDPVVELGPPFAWFPGPPAASGALILQPLNAPQGIFLAYSDDAGRTWTKLSGPSVEGQVTGFPVLAFDATGTAYLAAAVDEGGFSAQLRVHVWRSEDAARSWSKPTVTTPEGSTAIFPWIQAGADGHVVVASYENTRGTDPNADAATWYPRVTVSTRADQTDPRWNGTQVTQTPVRIGPICTMGAGCEADDWQIRDYFETDLTHEGHPFIAYAADGLPGQAIGPGAATGPTDEDVKVMATVATDGWQAHPT